MAFNLTNYKYVILPQKAFQRETKSFVYIGLCSLSCECVLETLNLNYTRTPLTGLYFVTKDVSSVGLCFKRRISVLTSDGNSIHLPQIKRTRSLMIGSEYDRVGYVV